MVKDKITFEVVQHPNENPYRRVMLRTMHNGICVEARRFASVGEALAGADDYVTDCKAKGYELKGNKVTIMVNY